MIRKYLHKYVQVRSRKKKIAGFTLVELLMVIALLAILYSSSFYFFSPSRIFVSLHDATRKHNQKELQLALNQFFIDESKFPTSNTPIPEGEQNQLPVCRQGFTPTDGSCINVDAALVPPYITVLPQDNAEPVENFSGYVVYLEKGKIQVNAVNMGKTLQEAIEARNMSGYEGDPSSRIPSTNETQSYSTYDDGWYQIGNPSYTRYIDNGDNTVSDFVSGLQWTKESFGSKTRDDAIVLCENLWQCKDGTFIDKRTDNCGGHNGVDPNGKDWRLPNLFDLTSLVDFGATQSVNSSFFTGGDLSYWTSTSQKDAPTIGYVVYSNARNGLLSTLSSLEVRCERGGVGSPQYGLPKTGQADSVLSGDDSFYANPSTYDIGYPNDKETFAAYKQSSGRFSPGSGNDAGTILDNATGLQWTPNVSGRTNITWFAALTACHGLNLANHSDWRLPNINEQQMLLDFGADPLLPAAFFSAGSMTSLWTSTTFSQNTIAAWSITLSTGMNDLLVKSTASNGALCVRGGT